MDGATPQEWAELKARFTRPVVCLVMGVSGSGKTTLAASMASTMGWQYVEGDDLHPPANVEKMRHGTPLTDEDRWPWLERVASEIDGWRAAGLSGVATCSALKRSYRNLLIGGRTDVHLLYLRGDHNLIASRMAARHEHFMPTALLDSQFATLEEPTPDERPIIVPLEGTQYEMVQFALTALAEAAS
jgi:carbohydrate kinase (thermoresistant glucokinase family)